MGKDALEKQGEAECKRAENRALGNVCLKRKHERIVRGGREWESLMFIWKPEDAFSSSQRRWVGIRSRGR